MASYWRISLLLGCSVIIACSFFVPGGIYVAPGVVLIVATFIVARRAPHAAVCATFGYLCFEQFFFTMLSAETMLVLKVLPELMLLVVLSAIADKVMRRGQVSRAGITIAMLAGLMVLTSGLINAIPSDDFIYYGRKILRYVPLVLIMPAAFEGQSRIRFLQRFVAGLATVQLLVAAAQLVLGESAYHYFRPTVESVAFGEYVVPVARQIDVIEGTRLIGMLGTYMDFGLFLLFTGCIVAPFSLSGQRNPAIPRGIAIGLLAAIGTCLVLTFSRTTILAASVALGGYLLRQRRWLLLGAFASACVAVALLPFLLNELEVGSAERATHIVERLWGTYNMDYLDPRRYTRAFLLFMVPPAVLSVSPVVGIGPGYSRMMDLNLPNWIPIFTADNGYVSLLIQFGLVGVALFIALEVLLIRSLWKTWARSHSPEVRRQTLALLTFLIAIPAAHLFVDVLTIRYVSFMFWMVCGLAVGVVWRDHSSASLQPESTAHIT